MTMHILPCFYTTTRVRKQKSKPSKTQASHDAWVAKMTKGKTADKKVLDKFALVEYTDDMRVVRSNYVSAGMSGSADSCIDRSLMNKLHTESKQVREEILNKASRVMPLYNKGGLQFATPGEDMTQVGSKSRRG